jgi:hypothetical protein
MCQKISTAVARLGYRRCRSDFMSKRRTPWFWNTAVLARLAWLLLAVVFAAYASRALTDWGRPGPAIGEALLGFCERTPLSIKRVS